MPVFVTAREPMPRLPLPVAFVNVRPVEDATLVTMRVATWRFPLPVAFVNVRPVVDATLVMKRLAACRFPEPVAFVNVRPVEETVVARSVETVTLPAKVAVPVADTLNCVLEFTWKFTKSPVKAAGFMPIYVPEAELPP